MYCSDLPARMSREVREEFRSSHAGELGAVWIYRGILCASIDPVVRRFAREHIVVEKEHLAWFEGLIHLYRGSLLLPVWVIAGFLTGFLPALFGREAVFRTIDSVETFVAQHYQEQIELLSSSREYKALAQSLIRFQGDEIAHQRDASGRVYGKAGTLIKIWCNVVSSGSAIAVMLARKI